MSKTMLDYACEQEAAQYRYCECCNGKGGQHEDWCWDYVATEEM